VRVPTTSDTSAARRGGAALPWPRWAALLALLFAEIVVLMLRFDTDSLRRAGQPWWADEIWWWKFVLPPLVIAIATAAVLVGGERLRDDLRRAATDARAAQPSWPYLVAHLAAFALFARVTATIFEGDFAGSSAHGAWIIAWLAIAAVMLGAWGLTAFPPRALAVLARRSGAILATAVAVGGFAWAAGLVTETWWDPLRSWTIDLVAAMVGTIAPDPVVDAPNLVVGTERFAVRILRECAGYEGIGLIWVFLAAYLWMFRRVLRFPRALLLIPIGTAAVWIANVFRLTALIAIGTWISPAIALGGFHTYSGALLFSTIALGLAAAVRRSPFFAVADAAPAWAEGSSAATARGDAARTAGPDATTAHLLPFLVLLATTMLTSAFSADTFDVAYPLRVVATLGVLWWLRAAYSELRATWSWTAVAYGVAAFASWVALERLAPPTAAARDLGASLHDLPTTFALAWLACRVLGSIVAVPLAEELAFRGYVARRLLGADFQRVSLQRLSWFAILVSSVLFGAMHRRIVAGTLAGILFALAARRRGELTDAVVAHATTNALVATYVLATHSWSLWS
jgi:exosortase E/protease (VPEID-CTERM system)